MTDGQRASKVFEKIIEGEEAGEKGEALWD